MENEILDLIDRYWKFDNDQTPVSNWHDKQDLLEAVRKALRIHDVRGSLQDIQEIIEFLQWAFKKVDKGDTPEETVRMLLMNRAKIDNIKFNSNDRLTGNGFVSVWHNL